MIPLDGNTVLQLMNLGAVLWIARRQIVRLDDIESWVNKLRERVARLEAKKGA